MSFFSNIMFNRQHKLSFIRVVKCARSSRNFCDGKSTEVTSTVNEETVSVDSVIDKGNFDEFSIWEVNRFIRDCTLKVGCSEENAQSLACMLVGTDCLGIKSEGLNRLNKYVWEMKNGLIDGKAQPSIRFQTSAIANINGNNSLGHITSKYAMEIAILKAKMHGAGLVCCRNCNHFGAASLYGFQAVEQQCIGLVFGSSTPMMVTPGSNNVALGSNPITMSAPANNEYFNYDVATTAVSLGKIELKMQNDEDLPVGWAQKGHGEPAVDPLRVLAFDKPRLLPLGNPTFPHLGFGLALMVEMMSGILAGSNFGPYMRKYHEKDMKQNVGYTFLAINPKAFAPDFENRFSKYLKYVRSLQPIDEDRVVLSGDLEAETYKETLDCQFLQYNNYQIRVCNRLADALGVVPLRAKPNLKHQKS